ncbi:MAG: hypothetical protein ACO3V3_04250 [Burkholderiaceae bacterium]|jgi:hypothetical protein
MSTTKSRFLPRISPLRQTRVERFLVLLVWGGVVWLTALLSHRLALSVLIPPLPPPAQSVMPVANEQAVTPPLQKVFGGFDQKPLTLRQSDIQLVGFIEAGEDSVVAVRIRNAPTRYLKLMQMDSDGWRLESVKDGEIEISRLGEVYRLASYPSRSGLTLAVD